MKRFGIVLLSIAGLALVASLGVVFWASQAYHADAQAYASAQRDPEVLIEERNGFITIRPRKVPPTTGLLFYPGLKVAAEAYVAKLAAISRTANIQIAVGRPRWNIPALSIDQASAMRNVLPGVTHWYVGGHSMGGAMACLYASKHAGQIDGVVLLGTYCGSNLSATHLRVLEISGDQDGVMPPAKIAAHRAELPSNSVVVLIPGMNHAQSGNYGDQPGDRPASIRDEAAENQLAAAFHSFFGEGRLDQPLTPATADSRLFGRDKSASRHSADWQGLIGVPLGFTKPL